jgi:hypothetical protein
VSPFIARFADQSDATEAVADLQQREIPGAGVVALKVDDAGRHVVAVEVESHDLRVASDVVVRHGGLVVTAGSARIA